MSIKTLNEDSLSKIIFDEDKSLLTMIWKESTKDMIGPHFQGSLYIFGGFAIQKKSKKILIDVRKFLWHPPEYDELTGPWRTKYISPLYNEAGVQKFAFLFPSGAPVPKDEQKWPGDDFLTKLFTSESEMKEWLS
jgi:hypothetical protein